MPILRYLGHSACEIVHGETNLLIDPFLTGNPLAPITQDSLTPTAILITHAHNDHMGDSLRIAKNSGAQIIAIHEIATWFSQQYIPAHGMSIGGGFTFPWGWVKMTPALHGSTYSDEQDHLVTLGTPGGFLVKLGNSTLYHAGDTALFSDLALIGRRHPIDLALLPIGDNYTMGPDDAIEAARMLNAKAVVPIHYNTFPVIQQDPHDFARRVKAETSSDCIVLAPGETLEY